MTATFKVGDVVECIDNRGAELYLVVGRTYLVKSMSMLPNHTYLEVSEVQNGVDIFCGNHRANRFSSISVGAGTCMFSPGDIVECTDDSGIRAGQLLKGAQYTVRSYDNSVQRLTLEELGTAAGVYPSFYSWRFKLILAKDDLRNRPTPPSPPPTKKRACCCGGAAMGYEPGPLHARYCDEHSDTKPREVSEEEKCKNTLKGPAMFPFFAKP